MPDIYSPFSIPLVSFSLSSNISASGGGGLSPHNTTGIKVVFVALICHVILHIAIVIIIILQ
jgi:hypothetical protein